MTRHQKKSLLVWLRQALLLYILVAVALSAYLNRARSTDWDSELTVAIYPMNQDDSAAAADYIANLDPVTFEPIVKFLQRESKRYGIELERPARFFIGREQTRSPPTPPQSRNVAAIMWWSLRLRFHAWRAARNGGVRYPEIRLFVLYHDPASTPRLAHSLGLEQGLIGVVNAYASHNETSRNAIVIAHEMLHTLGASDKYDKATNLPLFPTGYAQPERQPRYPQTQAEIMGGRTPLSATEATMPTRLRSVVVGPETAAEINWRGD
ncbi:MAG: hypothetical protein AB8G17_19885 [Gammaproteobacteria bacterium]